MQWMMKKFSRELQLTDAQKEQLDISKTEMVIKGRALRIAYANIMKKMSLQLRGSEFDKKQLESAYSKTAALQEEFISLSIEKLAEFHGLLTPGQRTVPAEKLDKMQKYKKGRCPKSM